MIVLARCGFFWHIVTPDGGVSKKRFFTARKAIQYYYDHQDKDGFPITKDDKEEK